MKRKDFISIKDLTAEEIEEIFRLTKAIKADPNRYRESLKGKTLGMIFQKPSTRTRVSFEVGIYQLGGIGLYLNSQELQLGRGETISDTARVLSRYLDGIMARTFAHQDIVDLAKHATVPVINGLTDLSHPCQGICDYFTIFEKYGSLRGLKLAYIGDGNNVAHSLLLGAPKVGMHLSIATPNSYAPSKQIMSFAQEDAKKAATKIEYTKDPGKAILNADVVYTDVWTSMGQESERKKRLRAFKSYQINKSLLAKAKPRALFMHCLPAHRGEEVTGEVMDSSRSIVFDQAENRLHTQKAIMVLLMGQH